MLPMPERHETYRRMYETWLRALIGIFELAFCWEGAVQRSHQELLAAHEINKLPPKNLVRRNAPRIWPGISWLRNCSFFKVVESWK